MIGRSAKSHRYYYYVCNRSFKQGKDACSRRAFPKDRLERLVIDQIKERVLIKEFLEELVMLVNEELGSAHSVFQDRLEAIDTEARDVGARLAKLYEALETEKLTLDDLAPRLRQLRTRQDELSKARVQTEAELVAQGTWSVDMDIVTSYAQDLRSLLEEADIVESKAFLRSFIKRIEVNEKQAVIHYNLPMPPDEKRNLQREVLPIVNLWWA
jgi:chromosome segregation ATPase